MGLCTLKNVSECVYCTAVQCICCHMSPLRPPVADAGGASTHASAPIPLPGQTGSHVRAFVSHALHGEGHRTVQFRPRPGWNPGYRTDSPRPLFQARTGTNKGAALRVRWRIQTPFAEVHEQPPPPKKKNIENVHETDRILFERKISFQCMDVGPAPIDLGSVAIQFRRNVGLIRKFRTLEAQNAKKNALLATPGLWQQALL